MGTPINRFTTVVCATEFLRDRFVKYQDSCLWYPARSLSSFLLHFLFLWCSCRSTNILYVDIHLQNKCSMMTVTGSHHAPTVVTGVVRGTQRSRHLLYEGGGTQAPRAPHQILRGIAHSRRSVHPTAHEGALQGFGWSSAVYKRDGSSAT